MPSLFTHFQFGQDLLTRIDDSTKEMISKSPGAFLLGLQGPDIFLYDLIHTSIAKKKNLGTTMHSKRSDIFFSKYIEYLKDNHMIKDSSAVSYLFGMLCHYSLDCAAHPYVYYFTNLHDKSQEGKNKSLTIHCQFESDIDQLLYHDRNGGNICNVNRSKFLNISREEIEIISPLIAYAISETYKCDITSNYIRGTIKRSLMTNRLLNNKYSIKRPLLRFFEKPLKGNHLGTSLMFTRKLPSRSCLNENQDTWYIPVNNLEMTSSFLQLYAEGLSKATTLVNMLSEVLKGKCSISKFINETGGMSYHTGLNWRMDNEMKYFKSEV